MSRRIGAGQLSNICVLSFASALHQWTMIGFLKKRIRISILVFMPVFGHWLFGSLSLDLKPDLPELIDRLMGEKAGFLFPAYLKHLSLWRVHESAAAPIRYFHKIRPTAGGLYSRRELHAEARSRSAQKKFTGKFPLSKSVMTI